MEFIGASLFAFILLALVSMLFSAIRFGIGPVPTSPKVKRALLSLLPALNDGIIYELGAGFGNVAFALADYYPEFRVIAIEISPIPYFWMKIRQGLKPRPHLTIMRKDFFKLPLNDARLIFCYLYPKAMLRLEKKIDGECPQTIILTHTFRLPNRKAKIIFNAQDLYQTPIYIYLPGVHDDPKRNC